MENRHILQFLPREFLYFLVQIAKFVKLFPLPSTHPLGEISQRQVNLVPPTLTVRIRHHLHHYPSKNMKFPHPHTSPRLVCGGS